MASFIGARSSVDLSPLDVVNQTVLSAQIRMQKLQSVRALQSTRRVVIALAAPDDVPALPFIWSADKAAQNRARRWYFANKVNKGSAGGRYQRTGALEAANEVKFYRTSGLGGEFQFENPSSAFDYVYGPKQVPSHFLTGWPDADAVLNTEADFLATQIEDDWGFISTGQDS